MNRKEHKPEPVVLTCLNPRCGTVYMEDDPFGDINYSDEQIWKRMQKWKGDLPELGCLLCHWPVIQIHNATKSLRAGVGLGEEGMERAYSGTTPAWHAAALGVVFTTAQTKGHGIEIPGIVIHGENLITADDLYPEIEYCEGLNDGKPVNYSALGKVMKQAAALGWIEGTGITKPCERPRHHVRGVRIWRSLL